MTLIPEWHLDRIHALASEGRSESTGHTRETFTHILFHVTALQEGLEGPQRGADASNVHNTGNHPNPTADALTANREALRRACIDLATLADRAGWDYTLQSDVVSHGPTYIITLWQPEPEDGAE